MGIFSWGNPATSVALWVSKKFLEGKAPSAAQKLYNLNKKPYATSSLTRGNTISTGNGSSLIDRTTHLGRNSSTRVRESGWVNQSSPKLLPAPSGKPLSAKVSNLKPSTGTPKQDGSVWKQGARPWSNKLVSKEEQTKRPLQSEKNSTQKQSRRWNEEEVSQEQRRETIPYFKYRNIMTP